MRKLFAMLAAIMALAGLTFTGSTALQTADVTVPVVAPEVEEADAHYTNGAGWKLSPNGYRVHRHTGPFYVRLRCLDYSPYGYYYRYGPYVGPGSYSSAYCNSGDTFISAAILP